MTNITPIDGAARSDELAEEMRNLFKHLSDYIELAKFRAAVDRQYYLSLVERGFMEKQALELTKRNELI